MQRLDLILWLVSVDLLPEEPATRNPAHGRVLHIKKIEDFIYFCLCSVFQVPYQNLLRKTNDKMIDRLLFDVGVDDIGRLWGKDFFGNGSYPPSSFYVSEKAKKNNKLYIFSLVGVAQRFLHRFVVAFGSY